MNNLVILAIIIVIESNSNPYAYNKKSQARGLCQIRPVVLQEYNNKHKHKYNPDHLFLPEINKEIARWYLNVRIPQMIKHYGKPVTKENILIAYNAGISYVKNGKMIPDETKNYIKKYWQLEEALCQEMSIPR